MTVTQTTMQNSDQPCRRLIRAGMVPARAGQATQIMVHLTLAQVRDTPGTSAAEAAWAAARAAQPGWLTGPEADAAICDATVVPIVTGHVDWAALDQLTEMFLLAQGFGRHPGPGPGLPARPGSEGTGQRGCPGQPGGGGRSRSGRASAGNPGDDRLAETGGPGRGPANPSGGEPAARHCGSSGCGSGRCGSSASGSNGHGSNGHGSNGHGSNGHGSSGHGSSGCGSNGHGSSGCGSNGCGLSGHGSSGCGRGGCDGPAPVSLSPATRDRLRRALLGLAADALSGPDGLAARLRAALDQRPLTTISLPLDIGAAAETIPAHLRRAVTTRHACCAFPGCDQPANVCDIHHIIPRSRGGPTALPNLVPLCTFHHLTAIHRWGWNLTLHSDGTTTATSPGGGRTLHSHSPPTHSPDGTRAPPSHAA